MSLNTSTKKSVVLFQDLRDLFRALGDDTRQEIILLLADRGTMNVTDITAQVSLSRPAISHHLKVLTNSGLLMIEKTWPGTFL